MASKKSDIKCPICGENLRLLKRHYGRVPFRQCVWCNKFFSLKMALHEVTFEEMQKILGEDFTQYLLGR